MRAKQLNKLQNNFKENIVIYNFDDRYGFINGLEFQKFTNNTAFSQKMIIQIPK